MNCQECRDLFDDMLDRRVKDPTRRRMLNHLTNCPKCSARLERRRKAHAALFRALNHFDGIEHLSEGFTDRLVAECRRPRQWWHNVAMPKWALIAASLVAMAGFVFAATVVVEAINAKDGEATEVTEGSAAFGASSDAAEVPYVPDVALVTSNEAQQSCDSQLEIENHKGENEMNNDQNSAAALAAATLEEGGIAMKVRQFVDTIKIASLAALTVFTADAAQSEDPYIESDGTTIVNTGVLPTPDMKIEVDYAFTAIETDARLFGVFVGGGQNAAYYVNFSKGLSFHVGKGWVGGTYLVMPDLNRHTVVFDIQAGKVHSLTGSVTNKTESTKSTPGLSAEGNVPIALFGRMAGANGSTNDAVRAKARIYGAKFYKGGALVCNLVPCVKGDVAGFRDTVGGHFHSAEFNVVGLSAGGNVERIPDDGYIELASNDQTQADGARGGHFFDTGYAPGPNTRIEFDYALASNRTGSGDWYLLQAGDSTETVGLYQNANAFGACLGTAKWKGVGLPSQANAAFVRRTAIFDSQNKAVTMMTAGYANYANTNDVFTAFSANAANPIILGATAGKGGGYTPVRIYGLKIYESGSLVREYVPYVKNGAPGMKYGDKFVRLYWVANNGKNGMPKAGGDIAVSADRDRDAYALFSGAQTIDTGYTPNSKTKLVVDFGFANGYNKPQQILFDAASGLFCRLYTQNGAGTDAKYSWLFNKNWGVLHSGIAVDHQRRLLTIDSPNNQTRLAPGATDVSTYNGDSAIASWDRKATSAHTLVFGSLAVPDASKGYLYAKARLYRLTIYDDGQKVREYVPCVVGGVAGLYDLEHKDVAPLTAEGLTVSGRGYNGAEEWIATPQNCTITKNAGSRTFSARAVGAIRYKWAKNGTVISGGADGELTVAWARGGETDAYTVTPVYSVFGEETDGAAIPFAVKNQPQGMAVFIQ